MIKSVSESIEQRRVNFFNLKDNKEDVCFLFFGKEDNKHFLLMKTRKGNFDYTIEENAGFGYVYKIFQKTKKIKVSYIEDFFKFLDREEKSGLMDRFLSGLIY